MMKSIKTPTPKQTTMFTVVSDIHNTHRQFTLPKSDYLLLCGDFSSRRYQGKDVEDVVEWLNEQPVGKVVVILGNHERRDQKLVYTKMKQITKELYCLDGKLTTIDNFQFIGSNFPFHVDKTSMKQRDPSKPLICLSHEPPLYVMDYGIRKRQIVTGTFFHAGSSQVKQFVDHFKPDMHCFGHCHSSHGIMKLNNTLFVNGALVDDCNELTFKPIQIKFEDNKFIPTEQHKCITFNQFVKQISESPLAYLNKKREYRTIIEQQKNLALN